MKNNTLGYIFSENPEAALGQLTDHRSLAAVPVGGRYRIIDFVLSNMVNSGITNVGIITSYKNRSLFDHLGSGKDWDLSRKDSGLFIVTPTESSFGREKDLGGVDSIFRGFDYLKKANRDYVLVCDCNTVLNIDFDKVMDFHTEKDADITIVHTKIGELKGKELKRHILVDVSDSGRVTDIQVYPSKQKLYNSYLHMFLIKKELLMSLVGDLISHNKHSISKDLLLANIKKMKIYSYEFSGYKKKIDSISSFFEFNLDLLKKEVREELFGDLSDAIYTKIKDTSPTVYGDNSMCKNSFIADGCYIDGKVENSIIFRGVRIGENATVKNSIIMQNCEIMDGCTVENAIFDKEVILRRDKKMIGQATYPIVIGKNTII